MITVSKQENGVLFTFTNSDKYLYGNGTIEVPFNSLSIIADESDMITLRKAASNDIFLSARYDTDLGYRSKDDAIDDLKGMLFAETGGGSESGITPSEVQEMIDESVSGKADTSVVNQIANEAAQAILALSGAVDTHEADIADLWDTIDEKEEVIASALTQLNQDVADIDAKEEVIASALTEVNLTLDNKLDASAYTPTDLSEYWTSAQTQSAIDGVKGYLLDLDTIMTRGLQDDEWDGAITAFNNNRPVYVKCEGYLMIVESYILSGNEMVLLASSSNFAQIMTVTKLGSNQYSFSAETKEFVSQTEKNTWNGKADTSAVTAVSDALSGYVQTSAITTAVTSASTDSQIPSAKAVFDAIPTGGTGGMDDDMEKLISSSLNDLNDRKIDASEVMTKYQRKGDYATNTALALKANSADVMTLTKSDENEFVAASALVDLNNKFGGLSLVKITESDYAALTTKDDNTLYIVVADPT